MAVNARATYSGMLTFGTVMAKVKVYKGTDEVDKDVKLHLMHKTDGGAVKRPAYCEKCDEPVPSVEIGKAVNGVAVDDELLDSFKVASDQIIDIQTVVAMGEIDARLFEDPRYIAPDKGAETAVRAIRDGLARMKKPHAGIGKIAKEDKEVVVAVYVKDGALVIHDLRWPEELRDAQPYASSIDAGNVVSEKLSKGVDALLAGMIDAFNPADYVDEKGRLRAEVLRKIAAGGQVSKPLQATAAQPMDDLAAQIEAAVKRKVKVA